MHVETENIVWIGQAEVAPRPGNSVFDIEGQAGGFIAVAAQARDHAEFVEKVRKSLEELGVHVCEISGVRPLLEVLGEKSIEKRLLDAIQTIDSESVAFGTLFTYPASDVT